MYYWFTVNSITGTIGTHSSTQNPMITITKNGGTTQEFDPNLIPSGFSVVGPFETLDTLQQEVFNSPNLYLYQNNEFVSQPYFTLSTSTPSTPNGTVTITATLNNPPSTPPSEVTFSIGTSTLTSILSNGQASITLQIHPSVQNQNIQVSVSATGCIGTSTNIGGNQSGVFVQVVTPIGGIPTVGPASNVAVEYLQQYYAVNQTTVEALLTNTFTAINILFDTVFNVILPSLQNTSYTPISLSANQQQAVSAIKSDVLANLVTTLSNGYPSGATSPQMQFGAFLQNFERGAENVQGFMEALQLFT